MADFRLIQHVSLWLTGIATLTPNSPKGNDLKLALGKYAQLLAGEFPPAAFSPESEAAVAAQLDLWPSYGKLYELLRAWWRANRPPLAAITRASGAEEITRRDFELAREWDNPTLISRRVRDLGDDMPPAIRQALLSALAAAVMKYAPQHIDLLPVEAQAAAAVPAVVDDPPQPPNRPKPYYLSGERLLAAYEAAGLGSGVRAQMLREQLRQKPPITADNHLEHAD